MKLAPPFVFFSRAAALAALLLFAGCAERMPAWPAANLPPAGITASDGAAPPISVPPSSIGRWYDLGGQMAPWLTGDAPAPVDGAGAPTRIAGLQRQEDGRWLALVIVQAAPLAPPCPAPTTLTLPAPGNPGCLRLRRDADFNNWLESHNPALWRWLEARGLNSAPRQWVAYRTGRLEVQALVDPSLLEPETRTNDDFLVGGINGLGWVNQLAASAAHAAAGGAPLVVPPFPFAAAAPLPEAAAPAEATASEAAAAAPPPARANQ